MTTPGQGAPDGAFVVGGRYGQNLTEESAKAIMKGGVVSSFESAQGVAHGAYNNRIDDHANSITELRNAFEQLVLQGRAIVYTRNSSYTPSPDILSVEVIIIGAGGGGSSGSYDALVEGVRSGGGGGGGGETHTSIPASLLEKNTDGSFKPIRIVIGSGGAGASQDRNYGASGSDSLFGPEVGSDDREWLLGGGGQGGQWGAPGPVAQGGVGMIPGGNGGRGGAGNTRGTAPTPSVSAYALYGGGGGGGSGGSPLWAGTAGAAGGISPGGAAANPGWAGRSPAQIVATGGGGGGGGHSGNYGGGSGGFPGGGGGGSACAANGATTGGAGATGICYVIERTT
ncbi:MULTISPECIES: hypothetical protein [unclassified Nocardia]|uniref:glycine-rich domain-containing protein n=1 Tax=unclassified Nocardia TaxID=2637762 RepID=UPI00278C706B|nr:MULTISPECIES: hypothetical protein [unclassified Nocardia]